MNYIVFDLEATCWDQWSRADNETIEIGAILIKNKLVISTFQEFIKPLKYPILSDFCQELTSIKQEDVNQARYFYEVIEDFKRWIQSDEDDYVLCSWGYYDRRQFESDCLASGLETEWLTSHISLKHQYQKINNLRRAIGMKRALEMENFQLEGAHHRGIDDAKNISKIFMKYYDQWEFPS
ncbi:MAG: 3'-5' exonuclease [Cyanobacteria bacterium J06649_11]